MIVMLVQNRRQVSPDSTSVGTSGGLLTASDCGKADSPSTLSSVVGSSAGVLNRTGALQ